MESTIPIHVSDYSRTHHLLPWRPNTGFENIEVIPLYAYYLLLSKYYQHFFVNINYKMCFSDRARKCISNYPLDATSGAMHKPLKFPDLVTGCHRDSVHASKAALYTRYTPNEWFQKQVKYYNEADSNRQLSERLRNDALRIVRYVLKIYLDYIYNNLNY